MNRSTRMQRYKPFVHSWSTVRFGCIFCVTRQASAGSTGKISAVPLCAVAGFRRALIW